MPEVAPRRRDLELPPGVENYVTPSGVQALRDELDALTGSGAPDAATKQRINDLTSHLALAVIVEPPTGARDRVQFGATVTLSDDDERVVRYRIVGVAEADPKRGWVSFLSPAARALLGSQVGDAVRLPTGELEVTAIEY